MSSALVSNLFSCFLVFSLDWSQFCSLSMSRIADHGSMLPPSCLSILGEAIAELERVCPVEEKKAHSTKSVHNREGVIRILDDWIAELERVTRNRLV